MDVVDLKLQKEYAKKRAKAEKIALSNLSRARKVPAYLKLEKIEKELMFEIAKIKVSKPKDNSLNELNSLLKQVRVEKVKILKKIGMSEADLRPRYSCDKCFDTGFINGKMCDCYRARKNVELAKFVGLNQEELLDFSKIDINLIADPVQREELRKLKDYLEKWSKKYPNVKKKNITICGSTGLGKTHIAKCLAGELVKMGRNVCFISSFNMGQMFSAFHTKFDAKRSNYLSPLLYSEILVIDDLGTEPIYKNITTNYLTLLITERERMGLPVIITTNLLPENILDRYNERIYSRLASKQYGQMFHLEGKDLRLTKQKER